MKDPAPMIQISLKVPQDLLDDLQALAAAEQVRLSTLCRVALADFLANNTQSR